MPRRVWLLAWPTPTLPGPMPTRETLMPVLPSVRVSAADLGRLAARALPIGAEAASAAVAAVAVAWARKSRRWSGGVMTVGLRGMGRVGFGMGWASNRVL